MSNQQLVATKSLRFVVPGLPNHWLSSNGGSHSRRDPHSVSAAKMYQSNETMEALRLQLGADLPAFARRVDILVHGFIKVGARPKLEDCKQCLQLALANETWVYRLSWEKGLDGKSHRVVNTRSCACYRPEDPSNLGGETTKGLLDGVVRLGVIGDDSLLYVRRFAQQITRTDSLLYERIEVTITEVDNDDDLNEVAAIEGCE